MTLVRWFVIGMIPQAVLEMDKLIARHSAQRRARIGANKIA